MWLSMFSSEFYYFWEKKRKGNYSELFDSMYAVFKGYNVGPISIMYTNSVKICAILAEKFLGNTSRQTDRQGEK